MPRIITPVIVPLYGARLTADEIAFIREHNPYGFILFGRNCDTPDQLSALTSHLREVTGRDTLPILIDQEGGKVARLKPPHWPAYPAGTVYAAMYDTNEQNAKRALYLHGRLIANDLREIGITVDCAPVLDRPIREAHDVIGNRAYGQDPTQIALLGDAMARGLSDGGVVPVIKHIPGHGRAEVDSHLELPVVNATYDELAATDFIPFKMLTHIPMAMTAHVIYRDIDAENIATVSKRMIYMMRNMIGYDGLIMTDDLAMEAMHGTPKERAKAALEAGCDMILQCLHNLKEMHEVAQAAGVLEGKALERAIDAMKITDYIEAIDIEAARAEHAALIKDYV